MANREDNDMRVSSQVMELKDLISGPLVATIDADSISARRYLKYVFELAFESYDQKTGVAGKLRMLEFNYQVHDGGEVKTQKVSIPLLTLMPLPLLQVMEADFDFDIQIVDALAADKNATLSLNTPDEQANRADGLKLRVTMAPSAGQVSEHRQSNLTANMKVKVKMRQADMPGGLTKLLHLTTSNVMSEEVDAEEME